MRFRTILAAVAAIWCMDAAAEPSAWSGQARVIDGDTISIRQQRIRIAAIDACELDQTGLKDGQTWRCGVIARSYLRKMIDGQHVRCDIIDQDRYRRLVGQCFIGKMCIRDRFRPVKLQDGISFKPLYELIGCRLIEVVRFDEKHSLFVDEEGLCDGLTAFTLFEGYPQPLAGKLVLVGGDGSEPYTSPLISLEDASAYFTCCRPVVDPVFATADELTPRGLIITGALLGFQLRFERRSPTLVEGEA